MCGAASRVVHKTTHIGPYTFFGWMGERPTKPMAHRECIDEAFYSDAHSFDSRFSHAGLASLFITSFPR